MDILVIVFPIVLWQASEKKGWQWLGRGVALSLLLLKPQSAWLLWFFLIWQNRKTWKSLIAPLGIVALITVPISLLGSPPLFIQWLYNITNPSPQNQGYWLDNNVSLTNHLSLVISLLVVGLIATGIFWLYHRRGLVWHASQTTAVLMMVSMLISPYTSRQSVIAGLAFVPSSPSLVLQWLLVPLMRFIPWDQRSTESLIITVIYALSVTMFPWTKFDRFECPIVASEKEILPYDNQQ
jgi:hypothetical protein